MTLPPEITAQSFNPHEPENIGRPIYFDISQCLSLAEQYVLSDEVERALWLLDNLPGYYRDHVPPEVLRLKTYIQTLLTTPLEYVTDVNHINETKALIKATKDEINKSIMDYIGRAQVVRSLVERLNQDLKTPHIVEMAPGSFWLPIGLAKNELKFTYFAQSLNVAHQLLAKEYLDELRVWYPKLEHGIDPRTWVEPTVFVCFELIEHLHNPDEIMHNYVKHNISFNHILLSTPKYTINGGNPNWQKDSLGHLRTYTPKEFYAFATKHWPSYKWSMFDHPTMILVGEKQ